MKSTLIPRTGSTDKSKFEKVGSISKTDSTYVTLNLDNPIELPNAEFGVMVKYTNPDGNVLIPIETYNANISITQCCTSNVGESYYYNGSKVVDMKEMPGAKDANACIKAFTVYDKNKTKTIFTSSKYNIIDSKNIIRGISPSTTIEEFNQNILTNDKYKLMNKSGSEITNDETKVSTEMTILTDTNKKYNIIVKGDINGDGVITTTDLIIIKKHEVEIAVLTGFPEFAGDINEDGNITTTDMFQIKHYLCGMSEF